VVDLPRGHPSKGRRLEAMGPQVKAASCVSQAGSTPALAEGEVPHRAQHVPRRCRKAASNDRPQAGLPVTPSGVFPGALQGAFIREA